MATTQLGAIDQMQSAVRTAWLAGAAAAVGSVPTLKFEDTDRAENEEPGAPAAFGRVHVRHYDLSRRLQLGKRARFSRTGTLTVQCFIPAVDGRAKRLCLSLAEVVQAALQGKRTASVIFRDVSSIEVGVSGAYYQVNVKATFWWDELRVSP